MSEHIEQLARLFLWAVCVTVGICGNGNFILLAVEAYGAGSFAARLGDERSEFVKIALYDYNMGVRRIMFIFHAGRENFFAALERLENSLVYLDLAEHCAKLIRGHSAGAQDARNRAGKSDNGRLDADRAAAAVNNRGDFAVHVVHNMCGGRGTRLARCVRARRRKREAAFFDYLVRYRVRRHSYRHRVKPGADFVRDNIALREYHCKRSRPISLGERTGALIEVFDKR